MAMQSLTINVKGESTLLEVGSTVESKQRILTNDNQDGVTFSVTDNYNVIGDLNYAVVVKAPANTGFTLEIVRNSTGDTPVKRKGVTDAKGVGTLSSEDKEVLAAKAAAKKAKEDGAE